MPSISLDARQKAFILTNRGLDPSQYDILEDGSIVRSSNLQLSSGPTPVSNRTSTTGGFVFTPPEEDLQQPITPGTPSIVVEPPSGPATNPPSALESFSRGATEDALPTAISLGLAAKATGIGTALTGNPLIGLLSGLVTGIGSSIAASYGQRKLVPKNIQSKLFLRPEDTRYNPLASIGGRFFPSTALFNPIKGAAQLLGKSTADSPKVLSALGRGITGVATGAKPLSSAERNLLLNTGINVGIESAQDIYEQSTDERPFDPKQFLMRVGLATVLNEPTALGRKMGFPPTEVGAEFRRLIPEEKARIKVEEQ